MTDVTHNKLVRTVVKCFPVPSKAEEIFNLVREYEELRWDAFYGAMYAIERIAEIDERFKELGLTNDNKKV
jgi:hypothetical protein